MKKTFVLLLALTVLATSSSFARISPDGLSAAQRKELSFRKNEAGVKYTPEELSLRNRYIEVYGERAFLTHGVDKLKYSNIMEVMIKDGAAAKKAGRTLGKVNGIGSTGLVGSAQSNDLSAQ